MKSKNIMKQKIFICLFFLAFSSMFLSCQKDKIEVEQPDFITTTLPITGTVEGGSIFELSVPPDETVETYEWTVPPLLEIIEGQGTYKITVKASIEGGVIPEKSITVVARRSGVASYPRIYYKEISILLPPPSLEDYETKRYGSKTWMVANLNYSGESGNLGRVYNDDPEKAETYGRLYTWYEAMTGIPNATAAENPYKWGTSGIDDAGNPYTLDGSPAGSFNIQIQGACPEGWHIPNAYDWYDLIVAVKAEYNVSGNTLSDIASSKEGYIIAWDRDNVFSGLNLTNWGVIGPYFKGSSPQSEGGLWQGGTTFNYGGNSIFPGGSYPLYLNESANVGFNILPGGRWNEGSRIYQQDGLYSYHWSAYLLNASNNYPLRFTIGSGNANFSNAGEAPLNGLSVRCVANY